MVPINNVHAQAAFAAAAPQGRMTDVERLRHQYNRLEAQHRALLTAVADGVALQARVVHLTMPVQQLPNAIEDPVTVPRGLLGAACSALDVGRDAPKTLAELRRYTIGDLSKPVQQPADQWECAANGSGPCQIGPHGPAGSLQCAYCGEAPDALVKPVQQPGAEPVDMVLHCPKCGTQHIDTQDEIDPHSTPEKDAAWWGNPPHRSHLCHGCGHIWRPADVPTNGVEAIKTTGKADSPKAAPAQRQPLTPSLRRAAEFTRADLGPAGSNYPHVRELLAFAEQALGITAAPAAQKGE